ncbi:DNase1 protein [Seiridium cupressi]|uniref:Dnase1 protein n=1 Tax=Seiridium unicorne TaxID=138068 RepID=A0ABR2VJ46_9PEZI
MRFFAKITAMIAAASAVVSATNTVTFVSQDSKDRKIIFTPSIGNSEIASIEVSGGATETVTFPTGWIGNWYAVCDGSSNTNGMLGEVTFQGWNDITYFDVSAIVNANDFDGVHEMWPASQDSESTKTLMSGCAVFPCNTAYYLPDDVQTVTTTDTALYCTLGSQ